MASEFLTTKEVAELLRIKERKVYDLAAEQQIPCTRATGKLLFSRDAITQWLAQHSSGDESQKPTAQMLFAGSHDPLLEWAIRESQCEIPVLFDGSVDGLSRVMNGDASVSAMHIYAPKTKRWNVDAVEQYNNQTGYNDSVVLMHWVSRQRGLLIKPGLAVSDLQGMVNHKSVIRQAGAGSQLLLQQLLDDAAVKMADLDVALTARSEADVALAIAEGRADCGLGLEFLARQHQLDFIPLLEESFDLLVDRRFWFEPAMQKFKDFCCSESFSDKVGESIGYQTQARFVVVYNS